MNRQEGSHMKLEKLFAEYLDTKNDLRLTAFVSWLSDRGVEEFNIDEADQLIRVAFTEWDIIHTLKYSWNTLQAERYRNLYGLYGFI